MKTSSPTMKTLNSQVARSLAKVRTSIQQDGGDVELVDVQQDGLVKVRFLGACIGCPSSQITLTLGVERMLKEDIPQVTGVVCVDDESTT